MSFVSKLEVGAGSIRLVLMIFTARVSPVFTCLAMLTLANWPRPEHGDFYLRQH